jgi:D-sedoheptulose 7-phosphate isomerase
MIEPKTEILEILKSTQIKAIKEFSSKLLSVKRLGKRVYLAGNGGSSSTASHFAADLMNLGFDVVSMVDNASRLSALTNDMGWHKVYTGQMKYFSGGDGLVLFTVHGGAGQQDAGQWSQNLVGAASLAKEKKGEIFIISGNNGGDLVKLFPTAHFLTVKSGDVYIVEGIHSIYAHLICHELKKAIQK